VIIQEDRLKGVLLRAVQSQCAIADAKAQLAKAVRKGTLTEQSIVERELREQQRRLEKSQGEAIRYYEEYVDGKLSKEQFLERKADCRRMEETAKLQASLLSKRLEQMKAEAISAESMIQDAEPLGKYIQVERLTPELIRELVQRIVIYPGGAIHIDWNFSDTMKTSENLAVL